MTLISFILLLLAADKAPKLRTPRAGFQETAELSTALLQLCSSELTTEITPTAAAVSCLLGAGFQQIPHLPEVKASGQQRGSDQPGSLKYGSSSKHVLSATDFTWLRLQA